MSNKRLIFTESLDMWMSMLFHFDMDLAAVHRQIGEYHGGSHQNADLILS
jgi:hypothetical protein